MRIFREVGVSCSCFLFLGWCVWEMATVSWFGWFWSRGMLWGYNFCFRTSSLLSKLRFFASALCFLMLVKLNLVRSHDGNVSAITTERRNHRLPNVETLSTSDFVCNKHLVKATQKSAEWGKYSPCRSVVVCIPFDFILSHHFFIQIYPWSSLR